MIKVLILNCSLKKSLEISNTDIIINIICNYYKENNAKCEIIRLSDYYIADGISSSKINEDKFIKYKYKTSKSIIDYPKDEWTKILKKIKESDILLIGTPIWFGSHSSIAQKLLERLIGTFRIDNNSGQFSLYNKVACVVATGNEDGCQNACSRLLYSLSQLGCTIPPNVDCYWNGQTGLHNDLKDIISINGDYYINRISLYLVHNSIFIINLLKKNPIPINLLKLDIIAKQKSLIN
jgi:multimeric flavodoxin WrbA